MSTPLYSRLTTKLVYGICMLAGLGWLSANDVVPRYDTERYAHIWEDSPFEEKAFAGGGTVFQVLSLVGILKSNGDTYAIVIDNVDNQRMMVGTKPNYKGFRLKNIMLDEDPAKIEVEIETGDKKIFNLSYNAKTLSVINPSL